MTYRLNLASQPELQEILTGGTSGWECNLRSVFDRDNARKETTCGAGRISAWTGASKKFQFALFLAVSQILHFLLISCKGLLGSHLACRTPSGYPHRVFLCFVWEFEGPSLARPSPELGESASHGCSSTWLECGSMYQRQPRKCYADVITLEKFSLYGPVREQVRWKQSETLRIRAGCMQILLFGCDIMELQEATTLQY